MKLPFTLSRLECGVHCLAVGLLGPFFFENTVNLERYIDIVHEFLGHLTEEEIAKAWFQQDCATCHTARATMHEVSLLFRDRIILKGLWPHTHRICHHQIFFYGATLKTVPTAITHTIWMN
jgi:hypothetical protein